ncbi:VCBS repeat-containing protein, partial [Mesorhizobium salmacidum]
VLLGNGDGTFAAAVNMPTGTQPWSVAIGDLDGIGGADLAVANYGSNSLSVLLNNSTGLSAVQHTTVAVSAVNDAPVLSSVATSATYTENAAAQTLSP